ncbi:putative membrane protein [Bacillus pakistanensis]|uniref:Membrane protein n=1 Tax=Rossellomorea pakistanensis TaxID=992288 RepID=A0ABS2N791_9BACI|nr:DoxX family membrane protein [Bacillus pakistanensis]MBM7583720.1 putative membrane protein [Bacillus pakistanensis]
MIPFIILVGSFLILRLLGFIGFSYFEEWELSLRFAVAIMFLFTGAAHWGKRRQDLIKMVPPLLPRPEIIVTITGIFEIVGAIGLLFPFTSKMASVFLGILLVVMFPANIYAAKTKMTISHRPTTPLLLRTVLQIVIITAVMLAGLY